jgi:Raf kinase inhibitor-like YbhB/YbcL family protein
MRRAAPLPDEHHTPKAPPSDARPPGRRRGRVNVGGSVLDAAARPHDSHGSGVDGMAFTLSSPAFVAGGDIPRRHTCNGEDVPPQLVWSGPPNGTRSFVLIVDDPDAPNGTFTHWVVFDIPGNRTDLPSGTRSDAVGLAGRNSRKDLGYMGPCPPSGTHRYFFRLSAVDVETLGLTAAASRDQVEGAIAAHTIGVAELMGRYTR